VLRTFLFFLFAYLDSDGAFGIGLPDGVLNVVHGTVPTVNRICDHPDIKAISFVGGDKAGRHIYERSASRFIHQRLLSLISTLFFRGILNGKRVQANLGAKNHAVIMPDGIAHIDYW
jgi:malonate-semialdehyde dehydrogenase (acetylating)/methylmalonate-semialdehyde dehydrogenase